MIRIILSTELGKRRWTQAKLARKTKIRPSTITFYYNDITDRVNLQHLNAICNVLGCGLLDILSYEPDGDIDSELQMDVHTGKPDKT